MSKMPAFLKGSKADPDGKSKKKAGDAPALDSGNFKPGKKGVNPFGKKGKMAPPFGKKG